MSVGHVVAAPLQEVVDEVRAHTPSVNGADDSPPEHIMVGLAAQHRWRLRNSAALAGLNQRLAKRRGDTKSAQRFGQEIDQHIKDIAHLDQMHPKAKKAMVELDKAPPEEA